MVIENKRNFIGTVILIFSLVFIAGCSPKMEVEDKHPASLAETTQLSPTLQAANDKTPADKRLTQCETAEQFVKNHGYVILMNSGANFDLQFPITFNEKSNGVQIGDLLKKRNELSKQNGLDFSSYLGKQVTLITYGVENQKKVVENIDLIMDGNKIVGFWIDNHREPPDFNVIVSAYQAH
ncbi:MAG: DUF4830 domain-containing protein [Syntrophomonadaceae bacterium]|nr:DUF4830 domain-containing protein [Fermentimonas sp.]MDD3890463.1 DUF4830 domain-containing protein [Syntrophomonadaceae bacterium]MDD4550513.1 DUF4830 domain-containing protein [Syntrophomonadaceae bacterium]